MSLRVAIAQIAPVLLDRAGTLARVESRVREASGAGCGLVAFAEAFVPGYPVWTERTDGARFDSADQKRLHARYCAEAVQIEAGHLDGVRRAAREGGIAVVLGVVERPRDRGGHTLYCTAVFIDADGEIRSAHRKLMPTYEERLSWGIGDGAGLLAHDVGPFRVGVLNCWENWMPLARAAMHAEGVNLHVTIWPGGVHLTEPSTRFIAREGRMFVLAASAVLRGRDLPADFPLRERVAPDPDEAILTGGSAIAGPDGRWIVEPVAHAETLVTADLDIERVLEERQNFDPAGHYARPDVLRLVVDRRRQGTV